VQDGGGKKHDESRQRLGHDELSADDPRQEPDNRLRQAANPDDAAGQRVLHEPRHGTGQQPGDRS
jgi:hypothetical protein